MQNERDEVWTDRFGSIRVRNCKPASESEIAQAELELGASLPGDYRSFLLRYNAAILEDNCVGGDEFVHVDRFIPIQEATSHQKTIEGFPCDAVTIAEAGGGDYFYMQKGTPGVYFWWHEQPDDKKLASTFSGFLDAIQPFDHGPVDLDPKKVISVWVDPDFKPEWD